MIKQNDLQRCQRGLCCFNLNVSDKTFVHITVCWCRTMRVIVGDRADVEFIDEKGEEISAKRIKVCKNEEGKNNQLFLKQSSWSRELIFTVSGAKINWFCMDLTVLMTRLANKKSKG